MVIRDKQDIINSWIMKIVFLEQSIRDGVRHVTFCYPPKHCKKLRGCNLQIIFAIFMAQTKIVGRGK